MFDHAHYVPILRWKPAEQTALRKLRFEDKAKVTPLIEFVPRDFKAKKGKAVPNIERVLHKKAKEINTCWGHSRFSSYIARMSRQTKNTGNATTWLCAGINHHLTFVVRQIDNMFRNSGVGATSSPSNLNQPLQRVAARKSRRAA